MCKIITHFLWKVFVLPPPAWEADREPVHQNCTFRWGNDISLWRTTQYYVLFSTSNWNVLVKFQWLLEDGDLTQLNCLSFCLLALGPMAVIPWFALGELRSLCALCFISLAGAGFWDGPMVWITVLESDKALWSGSANGRWQLWKADCSFLICHQCWAMYCFVQTTSWCCSFSLSIFICLWCTEPLEGIDFQPLVLLMFHCIDTWRDCPDMLWKPLSICFFFPEHRS